MPKGVRVNLDFGMRVDRLAAETGWSQSYIRKMIRDGRLDGRRVGRTVIVTAESVRLLIDSSPRIGADTAA